MKHLNKIITGQLLFIFILLSGIALSNSGILSITGFQIANATTQDSIRQEIETNLPEFDFMKDTSDVSLCIIVRMSPILSYSYDVVKFGDVVAVTNSNEEMCKGINQEDFIVSYVSYDKLKEHLTNKPSLSELKAVGDGTYFYLYPSRQVDSGVKIAMPDEFNSKFNNVATKYFTSQEIKTFKTVQGETQSPSPPVMNILYIVAGVLVLVVVVSLLILMASRKPTVLEDLELVSYIKSMLAQGYQEEQIRQTLIENGWKQENIETAFKTAKTQISVPPSFN